MPTKKPAMFATEETAPEAAATGRKSLFGVFTEVDKATGPGDINNLELEIGQNKFRIIDAPILIRKHWDLPQSAEGIVMPCLKHITDIPAYIADPEGHLETLADCPWCSYEKEFGSKVLGKDKGMYNGRNHWVFNVVQDGVAKIAEFYQRSILKGIAEFEVNPEWQEFMPNGLEDVEMILTKKVENKKTAYSVSASPKSKPLTPEELSDYRKQAMDLAALKKPPTDEDKIADLMKKGPKPTEADRPKVAK